MNNVLNDLKEILRISTVTEYTRLGFTGVFVADQPTKINTILNYTEDNAKRIIDKVLSYHKHKINNPILKEKQSAKIGLNKNLNFKV